MNAYQRTLKELIAPHLTNSVKTEQLLSAILLRVYYDPAFELIWGR